MGMGFGEMLLMMVLMQSNANDLLDFMDSPSYWKAQQVEMTIDALAPSVKGPAAGGEKAPKAGDIRRLMAIRSLGELKKKEALPHLKPLVNDKAPFVADYANQAIAAIEAAAYSRPPVDRKKLTEDIGLLPVNCAGIAQITLVGGGPVSYDKVFEQMKGMMGKVEPAPDPEHQEEMNREMDKTRKEITDALIELAGKTGNLRLDAVTLGVAGNLGEDAGFIVLVGRGSYDAAAARETIKAEWRAKTETIEGFEVTSVENGAALVVCPSNDRFLFFAGPNRESLPVEEVLAALKEGKRDLPLDPDTARLLGSIDRSKRLWAVMKITDAYKEEEFFAPFDSMTLTEDDHGDESQLTVIARGKDPDQIAASVETFEKGRRDVLKELKQDPDPAEPMAPGIVDFLESVKVRNEGMQVTATATFKGSSTSIFPILLFMMFGVEAQQAGPVPLAELEPAPAPVQ